MNLLSINLLQDTLKDILLPEGYFLVCFAFDLSKLVEILLAEASSSFAFLSLNSGLSNAKQVQIVFVTLPQVPWSLSGAEETVGLHLKSAFVGIRWFSSSVITNAEFSKSNAMIYVEYN